MYREITRWHHVRPSLAFNAQEIPGTGRRAHPGLPLILLYGVCAAAPPLTVAAVFARLRRRG